MSTIKKQIEEGKTFSEKIKPLFRLHDDILDPELVHFALRGRKKNNEIKPVTVFTTESQVMVEERLKSHYIALGATTILKKK